MWFLQWVSLANTVLPTEIIICRFADEWGGVPPPHTPPVAPPLHTIDIFCRKYLYFEKCITNMADELFEVSFTKLADTGKALSRCGKCVRYMKLVSAKPIRLHCSHCDETYSLPQNGTTKLYKELKCPLDDFGLVIFSTGSQGKTTPICPYCYNNPPFPSMKKGMGCPECRHPSCKFSPATLSVCPCLTCERVWSSWTPCLDQNGKWLAINATWCFTYLRMPLRCLYQKTVVTNVVHRSSTSLSIGTSLPSQVTKQNTPVVHSVTLFLCRW